MNIYDSYVYSSNAWYNVISNETKVDESNMNGIGFGTSMKLLYQKCIQSIISAAYVNVCIYVYLLEYGLFADNEWD